MRRHIFGSTGRRGTVIAASAAVLCLGGALAACGGTGDKGYVAVGAAGAGPAGTPSTAGGPSDEVTLIPLDTPGAERGDGPGPGTEPSGGPQDERGPGGRTPAPGLGDSGGAAGSGGTGAGSAGPGGPAGPDPASPGPVAPGESPDGSAAGGGDGSGDGSSGGSGGGSGDTGTTPPPSSSPAPAGPAALQLGDPVLADADRRWCEQVTVEFRNTGGSPVRSGVLTFETHVIGALGVDWATVESTQPLPTPIDAGAVRRKTYAVCVESWRVPLGMRTETRDVTATWK